MKHDKDFQSLKKTLLQLSDHLIKDGEESDDIQKWFLGNALGTIIMASESMEGIKFLTEPMKEFCEMKRGELEELESLEKEMNSMKTSEIPGISDLLLDAGISLN